MYEVAQAAILPENGNDQSIKEKQMSGTFGEETEAEEAPGQNECQPGRTAAKK